MATVLAVAAAVLGQALQFSNGTLAPWPIRLLALTVVLTGVGVSGIAVKRFEAVGDRAAAFLVGVGITAAVAIHLTTPPGMYLRVSNAAYVEHHYWIAIAAILAGASLSNKPWLGRFAIPLLLVVHFCLGLWLLRASPNPFIDVFAWHREAFQAIGHGVDPYAISMPNIYGRTDWYAPGIADATKVDVGYPYPPLSLLLASPGHLIADDYRYANLFAITASGGLIAYARPSRLSKALAALFLLTPRGLFVLEQGWTEANVVLMLALAVFVACRRPALTPYAFGLVLAVKQYFILTLPLGLFLVPDAASWREVGRFFGKAVGVAAAITLPLALWNPMAFLRSAVFFQGKQPFRSDALSFLAATANDGVPVLPLWMGFVMVLVALGLALWKCPRTPAGYAAGSALTFLLFFAFSKQAFCNYYFMITGALSVAAAAASPQSHATEVRDSGEAGPSATAVASKLTALS